MKSQYHGLVNQYVSGVIMLLFDCTKGIGMPSTRRQFAICSAALLSGFAGCSGVINSESLQEIHLDLWNRTDTSLTFHFVLEATNGLGQWREFTLDSDVERRVVFQPVSERKWSGYHAVTEDKQVSGTLLGQGEERTCLQLNYTIQEDQIVATLPTDQPLCEDG